MTTEKQVTGLERRERRGREKRLIGIETQKKMLPKLEFKRDADNFPNMFAVDALATSYEDSYCDCWSRNDILEPRLRSLFTIGMMIGVGNIGNQYELAHHAPAAIYNGATVEEIAAVIAHSRMYVAGPAQGWAMETITKALTNHGFLEGRKHPDIDLARREKTGSEKRKIARAVLREMDPDSSLLSVPEELLENMFAPELEYIILENCYFDLWSRTDVLDRRVRSIVTLGMLIGLHNYGEVREHIPVALRNGVTVPELAELLYHAAGYLGFPTGKEARAAIAAGIEDAKAAGIKNAKP